jgi:hypothetical protein
MEKQISNNFEIKKYKTTQLLQSVSDFHFKIYFQIFQIMYHKRQAIVTPIFKKGDKFDVSNYRPISLTCLVCKLLERIITHYLLQHFHDNSHIPTYQHGFLPNRSVITNLVSSLNSWTKILDQKGSLNVVYLDFSKEFDKVSHILLLHKLQALGVTDRCIEWIKAFLSARTFVVRVGSNFSLEKSECCQRRSPRLSFRSNIIPCLYV